MYLIGDTFTTGGINAKVHPHAGDVQANIEVYGRAGVGNEMYPNNVAVEFDATSAGFGPAVRAKFDYFEAGGINVMEVNGSVINFPHFFDFGPLNGSTWATAIGSVTINVTSFAVPAALKARSRWWETSKASASVAKSCSSTTCASNSRILAMVIAVKATPTRTVK